MLPQSSRRPISGDVVITSNAGLHFLSVVPHPHRLSFSRLEQATNIAIQWARANETSVWHTRDNETFDLVREAAVA